MVDSSIKFGVAYVLLQVSPEGKVSVVRCGSCSVPKVMAFTFGHGGGGCWDFVGDESLSVLFAWGTNVYNSD